ncbi:MAG: hypothetical protein WCJ02_07795, partial [bacterium]
RIERERREAEELRAQKEAELKARRESVGAKIEDVLSKAGGSCSAAREVINCFAERVSESTDADFVNDGKKKLSSLREKMGMAEKKLEEAAESGKRVWNAKKEELDSIVNKVSKIAERAAQLCDECKEEIVALEKAANEDYAEALSSYGEILDAFTGWRKREWSKFDWDEIRSEADSVLSYSWGSGK